MTESEFYHNYITVLTGMENGKVLEVQNGRIKTLKGQLEMFREPETEDNG